MNEKTLMSEMACNPPKKSKKEKIYEDDNYIIEKVSDGFIISYFEDGHYVDDMSVKKDYFILDYLY